MHKELYLFHLERISLGRKKIFFIVLKSSSINIPTCPQEKEKIVKRKIKKNFFFILFKTIINNLEIS